MLLPLLLSISFSFISGCEVGVPNEVTSHSVNRYGSSSGTQVYLGLENSASCGGYLRNYTICQLNKVVGRNATPCDLSIWEPAEPFVDSLRAFMKIQDSEIVLPLTVNNSCGIDPDITPLDRPTSTSAREWVCLRYCFPNDSAILVKRGSVPGVVYPNGIMYSSGQILAENTRQTEGICVGSHHRLVHGKLLEVSCPLTPVNITTGLLAGAGIDPIYCPALSVQYGNINVSGPYTYGTVIGYTCQTGFQLVGVSSQTCLSSGDWSDEVPYCTVLNCTDPGVPVNGGRLGSDFTNGSVVSFTCNNGYTLQSTGSVMCYRGSWTAPVPNCNNMTSPSPTTQSSEFYQYLSAVLLVVLAIVFFVCSCGLVLIFAWKRCISKNRNEISTLEMRSLTVPSHYDQQSNQLRSASLQPYTTTTEANFGGQTSGSIKKIAMEPYTLPHDFIGTISPPHGYYAMYSALTNEGGGDDEYVVPANVEQELYLQLDRIKVKRIPSSELKVLEMLGSGYFAIVNKAIWLKPDGGEEEVAVKVLSEKADKEDKIKFLQEAALMGQFKHTNVLTLHGVVSADNNVMIVTELMKGGDLRQWLLKRKEKDDAQQQSTTISGILLNFCRQICLGMSYLSSRKFVHRDLAARNILVTEDDICKISDFGMSRDLTEDEDYYMAGEGGVIPVKWTAPEAIKQRKYSSASDVWSYGCIMYEIWSLGRKPFDMLKNNETLKTIQSGHRLSPTPGCPRMIYDIMMKCWHPESKKRPSFNEIMLLLLKEDQTLLLIPEDDLLTHSQAGQLGAGLDAGEKLYGDLQSLYVNVNQ